MKDTGEQSGKSSYWGGGAVGTAIAMVIAFAMAKGEPGLFSKLPSDRLARATGTHQAISKMREREEAKTQTKKQPLSPTHSASILREALATSIYWNQTIVPLLIASDENAGISALVGHQRLRSAASTSLQVSKANVDLAAVRLAEELCQDITTQTDGAHPWIGFADAQRRQVHAVYRGLLSKHPGMAFTSPPN